MIPISKPTYEELIRTMSAIILHGLSVAQLDPWRLALWVAVTENLSPLLLGEVCLTKERTSCCAPVYDNAQLMGYTFTPHAHWSQGGPLVEKYGISLYSQLDGKGWYAHTFNGRGTRMEGRTPLVAAMRSIVATKWGKNVERDPPKRLFIQKPRVC